jgi:3-keto-L-gulonate-6-phosphate decarboxylase
VAAAFKQLEVSVAGGLHLRTLCEAVARHVSATQANVRAVGKRKLTKEVDVTEFITEIELAALQAANSAGYSRA